MHSIEVFMATAAVAFIAIFCLFATVRVVLGLIVELSDAVKRRRKNWRATRKP
jgi:hypothetical protein